MESNTDIYEPSEASHGIGNFWEVFGENYFGIYPISLCHSCACRKVFVISDCIRSPSNSISSFCKAVKTLSLVCSEPVEKCASLRNRLKPIQKFSEKWYSRFRIISLTITFGQEILKWFGCVLSLKKGDEVLLQTWSIVLSIWSIILANVGDAKVDYISLRNEAIQQLSDWRTSRFGGDLPNLTSISWWNRHIEDIKADLIQASKKSVIVKMSQKLLFESYFYDQRVFSFTPPFALECGELLSEFQPCLHHIRDLERRWSMWILGKFMLTGDSNAWQSGGAESLGKENSLIPHSYFVSFVQIWLGHA